MMFESTIAILWETAFAKFGRGLEPDVMDGFGWVGLVLLTERGVSSSHPLGRQLVPPIDHLGANIRNFDGNN